MVITALFLRCKTEYVLFCASSYTCRLWSAKTL